jgi:predicted dehydrogenase
MPDRVRWGVLGCARIAATQMIPALKASRLNEAAAIASRDAARAKAAAAELGIPRAWGAYEALIEDPEVDAIYNPLPNHLHAPWTIRALEAGKHVLCEKPIALNAEEARAIQAAAAANGRIAAEAFMVRFHPQWRRVREMVEQGRLGRVRAVHAWFSYPSPAEGNYRHDAAAGGGVLYDIGGYAVVSGRQAFGSEPERAIGAFERGPGGVDVLTSGMVSFQGGGQLTFMVSSQLRRGQGVQVHGDGGVLEIESPFNPSPERPSRLILDDNRDLFGAGVTVEEVPGANQFLLQADAFATAIRTGEPFPYPVEDAVLNMRVIDAIFRSGESGRWEAV